MDRERIYPSRRIHQLAPITTTYPFHSISVLSPPTESRSSRGIAGKLSRSFRLRKITKHDSSEKSATIYHPNPLDTLHGDPSELPHGLDRAACLDLPRPRGWNSAKVDFNFDSIQWTPVSSG